MDMCNRKVKGMSVLTETMTKNSIGKDVLDLLSLTFH